MAWEPAQYLKFAEPRQRPAIDLLSRVALAAPRRIYDLGCGAGNVTRILAERWPDAEVTGIDDSSAMLAAAAQVPGRIRWRCASIAQSCIRLSLPHPPTSRHLAG
jgi:trans-aconitate 2-methyltransferase